MASLSTLKILVKVRNKILYVREKIDFMLVFFFALLAVTLLSFFSFKNPFKNPLASESSTQKNTQKPPSLELEGFTLSRFNENLIDTNIAGASMQSYGDREVYKHFDVKKINEKGEIENLSGEDAIHIGNEYHFSSGVSYTKPPNVRFFSQKGIYNVVTESFQGQGEFNLQDEGMQTSGQNIFYDKKSDVITANNIHSQITKK